MIVSLIAAMDRQRGIGYNGDLPWHLSSDLRRFKTLTMGHHVVMGRKTYESIGRPLPGRIMVVITRNRSYSAEGCIVVHSLAEAFEFARRDGAEEVFVIGGGEIFQQTLPIADRIYLTDVHATTKADVFFPDIRLEDWREEASEFVPAGSKDDFDHTYRLLVRAVK